MSAKVALGIYITLGLIAVGGISYLRYGEGSEVGVNEGYLEGNNSGYMSGFSDGFDAGQVKGYDMGFSEGEVEGREDGLEAGYENGFQEGQVAGLDQGFLEGNLSGNGLGYIAGLESGSSGYDVRDPAYEEALEFIEKDDTDKYHDENPDCSVLCLLDRIRRNSHEKGYMLYWVDVETRGSDGSLSFCGFNTTDQGFLFFSFTQDIFMDLEVGERCYDREVWAEPSFDDTITKINYIP
jgi:hypothetical protein